ncbi:hypothetical protein L6452_33958 [Arctium lappa]|uniref:Uncharacterized protein n=1 Tax=Arctium lappa TaxID=4217 RepID=A0ACB8YH16_ARCLA|nr:hypothetical protein L6452_33958 [Arctium lappa]
MADDKTHGSVDSSELVDKYLKDPYILQQEIYPASPSSSHAEDTFLSPDSSISSGHKKYENIEPSDSSKHIEASYSGKNIEASYSGKNIEASYSGKNIETSYSTKNLEPSDSRKNIETSSYSNSSSNIEKDGSKKELDKHDSKVGQVHHVDTAAPFESVKEAVSKFGGIVDWKAHRAQKDERRKYIEQELEKANEEIPVFKKKSEEAEKAKEQALRDLDSTKRLIEELKLNLERAQTEERQAKQDSELAQLRVQEMQQGIAEESSVAAKTQLEVAKARHLAAAEELISVRDELEEIRKDYAVLVSERDAAIKKAQEAVSAAKEIEREVENLTIQLITTKESIESTHAAHLESEEHRVVETSDRDQEAINWENELKQSEEELEKVHQQIKLAKDLRAKLDTASVLLQKLKDELAVYMQAKMAEDLDDNDSDNSNKFTRRDIQVGVASAKKSLDEVNHNIEKANENIMCLKTAANSLTTKLESEKAVLKKLRKQKGLGSEAVVSLESELKKTRAELDDVRKQEKETREKMAELPKQLKKVSEEAENAKSMAEGARLVLKKAKEAAEQAKSGANSMTTRLAAAQKEIEAARAAEKLALGAITALHESESARGPKHEEPKGGVTISLEEYYELSKRAHEAEEAANKRVTDAMTQIDEAKDSEMQSLNKLTQLNSELAARKDALNVALQKAELAKESKLNIEQELQKRKGENDQKKKGNGGGGFFRGLSQKNRDPPPQKDGGSGKSKNGAPEGGNNNSGDTSPDGKGSKKKKKSFMPKFFMFMGGKNKMNMNMNMNMKGFHKSSKDNAKDNNNV